MGPFNESGGGGRGGGSSVDGQILDGSDILYCIENARNNRGREEKMNLLRRGKRRKNKL